jgi:hypothetical protein
MHEYDKSMFKYVWKRYRTDGCILVCTENNVNYAHHSLLFDFIQKNMMNSDVYMRIVIFCNWFDFIFLYFYFIFDRVDNTINVIIHVIKLILIYMRVVHIHHDCYSHC